jgi:hypothetical protein
MYQGLYGPYREPNADAKRLRRHATINRASSIEDERQEKKKSEASKIPTD